MSENMLKLRINAGFTLLELLVAVGIMSLIGGAIMGAFGQYRTQQSKEGAAETVLAALSQAHLDTMSSKNDSAYGVNFKSNEVIYYKGVVYPGDGAVGNVHYALPNSIEIANISLAGGTTTVLFKRLTGATDNFGTVDVRVKSNPTDSLTVKINQTGAISL